MGERGGRPAFALGLPLIIAFFQYLALCQFLVAVRSGLGDKKHSFLIQDNELLIHHDQGSDADAFLPFQPAGLEIHTAKHSLFPAVPAPGIAMDAIELALIQDIGAELVDQVGILPEIGGRIGHVKDRGPDAVDRGDIDPAAIDNRIGRILIVRGQPFLLP